MKYLLNKSNYHLFDVMEVNKLSGRSYFIPYPDRAQADAVSPKEKRYQSGKVTCLNGDWDFKFYPRPAELPDELDTDEITFDKLPVPSCWQLQGYDKPFYINIRYQFPFNPPNIPTTEAVGRTFSWMGVDQKISLRWKKPKDEYNFVGVYRTMIDLEQVSEREVISFLGVASCLDLYVNGTFVGYSEGAHNTAEFDLTAHLHQGQNELVCVVRRWCTGTYLEDQDMFRHNGIFRDVLLRHEEATDFDDVDAMETKMEGGYTLTASATTHADTEVTFTLSGHGVEVTQTVPTVDGRAEAVFENLQVQEWSAENPVCYNLYYETSTACVRERIGFKTVTIAGDELRINGQLVKFKGVNHHDTSPIGGYTMTPDEIERDVRLCKEYNIDTIRTSHYPPDPLLLEMADELGIYIVDEADLETHGTFAMQLPPTYNTLSHDVRWQNRYVDRVARMYQRDKLHANTSIFLWSLGNESGGYANTDAMYNYLKERSAVPVHYESAVHSKRIAYDVGSEMYPSVAMVHDVALHQRKQKELNDRPYFLCEYAHAMGVGPGNAEAYWQEIYAHNNLMGGCVWEMVDHAILQKDGTYTYGGDHGEWAHDGNFCVDGLFYPDRAPSTGAKIVRFIYRPLRVRHVKDDLFELFNTTAFTDAKRYHITFAWNDGTTTKPFRVSVAPLQKKNFRLPLGQAVDGTQMAVVTVKDSETGRVVSQEQITLNMAVQAAPATCALPSNCTVENGKLTLTLADGRVLQSAEEGTLLYRAQTDNDTNPTFGNTMAPYAKQKVKVLATEMTENGCRIKTRICNKRGVFEVTDTYEGCEGGILVTSQLHRKCGRGTLPRFGKAFQLDQAFDRVHYVGRTGESYCDMKEQFPIGAVDCTVKDMTEPNLRPQESGNRCDCTTASVTDGTSAVHFDAVDVPYELAVKPYTDRALMTMCHREDEARTGTYVTVQAFQQGIGTGSCGPAVMPEFQYPGDRDYTLRFVIRTEDEAE